MNALTSALRPQISVVQSWIQGLRRGDKVLMACAAGGVLAGLILGSSSLALGIAVALIGVALVAHWDNGGFDDALSNLGVERRR